LNFSENSKGKVCAHDFDHLGQETHQEMRQRTWTFVPNFTLIRGQRMAASSVTSIAGCSLYSAPRHD